MTSLANSVTAPARQILSPSILLSVVAFLVLPLAAFAPLGLAPLALVAAAAIGVAQRRGFLAGTSPWLPAGLLVFIVFGAGSALWALEPVVSLYKAGQLFFIFFAGLVLCASARRASGGERLRIGMALLGGAGVAAVLLVIERYLGMPFSSVLKPWPSTDTPDVMPLFRLNRGSILLAMLMFPAAWVTYRRWGWLSALLVVGGAVFVVLSLRSNAASVGLVLGLVVAVAVRWAPRTMPKLFAVGLVALSLLAPILAPAMLQCGPLTAGVQHLQQSAYHRLMIWNFASERIAERPLLGWGLDSSRSMPQGRELAKQPNDVWAQGELLPLHPHNAALQVRLELGLIGLLLILPIVAVPVWRARQHFPDDWALAAALGSVTVISVAAFASFGVWQSWWLCAMWIAISLCIAIMGGEPARKRSGDVSRY